MPVVIRKVVHFFKKNISLMKAMNGAFIKGLIWTLLTASTIHTQGQSYTVKGRVLDANTGMAIESAVVVLGAQDEIAETARHGYYTLDCPKGAIALTFSYVGYESRVVKMDLISDTFVVVQLYTNNTLPSITVLDERSQNTNESSQMSELTIRSEQIEKLPMFGGEVDIFRSLQLMPGIKSAGHLQSGISVRGGSRDQNLILLDGIPVYSGSHAFGLFSIFDSDVIQDVRVLKGGFPARYGGRLSSVVEMNMKEGGSDKIHGRFHLGLLTSKLMLEGPIGRKTRFVVSGRRMYWDLIYNAVNSLSNRDPDNRNSILANFNDLNGKITHRVDEKNKVSVLFLRSGDAYGTKARTKSENYETRDDFILRWRSDIAGISWDFSSKDVSIHSSISSSKYELKNLLEYEIQQAASRSYSEQKYRSSIHDYVASIDLRWNVDSIHQIRAGGVVTQHTYLPAEVSTTDETDNPSLGILNQPTALEAAVYLEDEVKYGRFLAKVGLRLSSFSNEELFVSLEPRLALNYSTLSGLIFKSSVTLMRQYSHLVTSESLGLPSDAWLPSGRALAPQTSWQYAVGLSGMERHGMGYEIEFFYKNFTNVTSFKEGANIVSSGLRLGTDAESFVTQGDGEAYGMEVLLEKKFGRLSGWLGYALGWNWRQFEEINEGRRFLFQTDRRHDLSMSSIYEISDRITVSGSWSYLSGNNVSVPEYQYLAHLPQLVLVRGYTQKNSYRLSPAMRLDGSVTFSKKKEKYERLWSVGYYNLLRNFSPVYVRSRYSSSASSIVYEEVGTRQVIVSISWGIKF